MKNRKIGIISIGLILLVNLFILSRASFVTSQGTSLLDFRGLTYELKYLDNPENKALITEQEIRDDLELFQKLNVNHIRTFGTNYGQDLIPQIAHEYDIDVATGAWVSWNATDSILEIDRALSVADDSEILVIGSGAQSRGEISRENLTYYLEYANNRTETPVTTLETWDFWIANMDIADDCDVIFIELSPILDDADPEHIDAYIQDKVEWLTILFPTKELYISIGWPSSGMEQATEDVQTEFYQYLFDSLEDSEIKCYCFEAFDVLRRELWSDSGENMGEHFGIFEENRKPKAVIEVFNEYFGGSVKKIPGFEFLISVSIVFLILGIVKVKGKLKK